MRHLNVNLMSLLLQSHSKPTAEDSRANRLLQLRRYAVSLYKQVSWEAAHDFTPGHYLVKEKSALDTRVTQELTHANLIHPQYYNALVLAIKDWLPTDNDLESRYGQIVRKALITALPQAQQIQQLQVICHDYKAHLKENIENQLGNDHPQEYAQYKANQRIKGVPLPDSEKLPTRLMPVGNPMDRFVDDHPQGISNSSDSLNAAIKKYAVVNIFSRTLTTPKPAETQIKNFKHEFQAHRFVIEKDRDSWGMKFAKAVVTVLSFGVAALCGIWSVKGKQAAQDLTQVLTSPPSPPSPPPVLNFTEHASEQPIVCL